MPGRWRVVGFADDAAGAGARAAFAGPDVDAGLAQRRGDLADLAADRADLRRAGRWRASGRRRRSAQRVEQLGGGAFPRGRVQAAGAGGGGEPVDGVGEGVALDQGQRQAWRPWPGSWPGCPSRSPRRARRAPWRSRPSAARCPPSCAGQLARARRPTRSRTAPSAPGSAAARAAVMSASVRRPSITSGSTSRIRSARSPARSWPDGDGGQGDDALEGVHADVVIGMQDPLQDGVAGDALAQGVGQPGRDVGDVVEAERPRGAGEDGPFPLVSGRGPVGGRLRVDQRQQGPDQAGLGGALLPLHQQDGVRDAGQVGGHHPADGQPVILFGQVDQLPQPVQGAAALGSDEGVGELGAAEDDRRAGLDGPAAAG